MIDEPSKRPSAAEVLALLRGEYVEHPQPVLVSDVSERGVSPRAVSKRPVLWAAGGLIGITALLAGLILRQPSTKPAPGPPPPPVVVAAPRPAAQAAPVAPVSPTRDVWRVIAYTFAKSKDAEKRAERINEKWPDAHAEVFSIVSGRSPFLVAVGGRMNRDEAQRFRKRAVAHGLPSGAYSQNFNH